MPVLQRTQVIALISTSAVLMLGLGLVGIGTDNSLTVDLGKVAVTVGFLGLAWSVHRVGRTSDAAFRPSLSLQPPSSHPGSSSSA